MKRSTLNMQRNNEKRRERTSSAVLFDVRALILTLMISLSMIIGSAVQFGEYVYAGTTHNAGSWAELKDKVAEASSGDTIIITRDVVATETITIGKNLTIQGTAQSGNKDTYIYRKANNADFPVFNVGSGGNLTLGDNLTLTGKTGTCTDFIEDANKVFKVVYHNGGTGDNAKVTSPEIISTKNFVLKDPSTITENGWSAPADNLTFTGWSIYGPKGGHNTKAAGDTFKIPDDKNYYGTMTAVAQWEQPATGSITVVWSNGMSGTDRKIITEDSVAAGTRLAKSPSELPSGWGPSGYKFDGWRLKGINLDPSSDKYGQADNTYFGTWGHADGDTGFDVPSGVFGTLELVAQWKEVNNVGPLTTWDEVVAAVTADGYVIMGEADKDDDERQYFGLKIDGRGWTDNIDTIESTPMYQWAVEYYDTNSYHEPIYKLRTTDWWYLVFRGNPTNANPEATVTDGSFKMTMHTNGYLTHTRASATGNRNFFQRNGNSLKFESKKPGNETAPVAFYSISDIKNGGTETGNKYTSSPAISADSASTWNSAATPQPTPYSGADIEADEFKWQDAPKSQRCDGDTNTPVYSDTNPSGTIKFTSGTNVSGSSKINTPKAFFVDVNGGGVLTIDGSNFEDFITDESVKNTAPITVTGGSTLDMYSGEIRNNKVGYGAVEADSQNNVQQLKQQLAFDKAPTNTAGGIIVSDNGTKVNLYDSAKIKNNQADAGAIILKDDAMVIMNKTTDSLTEPTIEYNVGWHHSGGVLVENGATLHLVNGHIDNNVAWGKGGAVWATEFGTTGWIQWQKYPNKMTTKSENDRSGRKGGNFIMDGGTLDGNFAFTRAGAVEVESNGVFLNSGTISNNKCKSLGGAIYIEGDSPIYTFTLNIENGYINKNTSYAAKPVPVLDQKLDGGVLTEGDAYSTTRGGIHRDGDWADWGDKHTGDGGGVWLCAMGGTSVFTSTDNGTHEVVINGNTAAQDGDTAKNNGWGDDFYISHRYGSALVQNLKGTWYGDGETSENSTPIKTQDDHGVIITGPKGMYSAGTMDAPSTGIRIINNHARNGGGIAANGTIILGEASDVYRYDAEFIFHKDWNDGLSSDGKEATFKLYYRFNGDEYELKPEAGSGTNGVGAKEPKYEVTLGPSTTETADGNEVMYRTEDPWTAKAMIPAFAKHTLESKTTLPAGTILNDGRILTESTELPAGTVVSVPLYRIKKFGASDSDNSDSAYYNLALKSDVQALFEGINNNSGGANGGNVPLAISWNIVVKELGDEYTFEPGSTTATGSVSLAKEVKLIDPDTGNEIEQGKFSVNNSTITFSQTGGNSRKKVNVVLTKTNTEGHAINGAKFWVYEAQYSNEDAIPIENTKKEVTATTVDGSDGKVVINELKVGTTYLVFEKAAAPGYKRAVDPWFIMINESGDTITLKKQKKAKHLWYYEYQGSNKGDQQVTEGTDYTTQLTNKSWPTHDNWIETVSNNQLVNEPITLQKVKKENISQSLANVTFDLYRASTDGEENRQETYYYTPGNKINADISSDAQGTIDLSAAIYGSESYPLEQDKKYFLFEKNQPDTNYKKQTAPWLVTITPSGAVSVEAYEDLYKTGADVTHNYTMGTFHHYYKNKFVSMTTLVEGLSSRQITNEWKPVELTKIKSSDNSPLGGAKFALYKAYNGPSFFVVSDLVTTNIESDATTGAISIPVPKAGDYFLFETEAPAGYVRAQSPWVLRVAADRSVTVIALSDTNNGKFYSNKETSGYTKREGSYSDGAAGLAAWIAYYEPRYDKKWFNIAAPEEGVVVTNKKLANSKASFELNKVNSTDDAKITDKNASFELYEANVDPDDLFDSNGDPLNTNQNVKVESTTVVATASTSNGVVSFSNIDTEKIYLLFETASPEGFKRSKTPWLIYAKNDGSYRIFKYVSGKVRYNNTTQDIVNGMTAGWTEQVKILANIEFPTTTDLGDTDLDRSATGTNGFNYVEQTGDTKNNLKNEPILIKFEKIKKNESGTKLEDAQFDLYYAKSEHVAEQDGKPEYFKFVVDNDPGKGKVNANPITFSSIDKKYTVEIPKANQIYLLFETNIPNGYADPIIPWGIYVDPDGYTKTIDSNGQQYGIWKVEDQNINTFREELAALPNVTDRYLNCNIITRFESYQLENSPMEIELIKYKNDDEGTATYSDASQKLSGAKFQVIKLDNDFQPITDARQTVKPVKNGLVKMTSANLDKVVNGSRIFIVDSKANSNKLFKSVITTGNKASYVSTIDVGGYVGASSVDAETFYLEEHEEHKVNGKSLYAFRNANGQYLHAVTGSNPGATAPEWGVIRIGDRFYDGQYTAWENGICTSLFQFKNMSISGQTGLDIRPYWYNGSTAHDTFKLRIKDESGTYLSCEGANNTTNRGIDIYIESEEKYMTEVPGKAGHYKATDLSEGYYQIVETAAPSGNETDAPSGYEVIPNDTNHRMIIKIENGKVEIVNHSDSRLKLTGNKLQLTLANDEKTEVPAKKIWVGNKHSNITSVEISLYANNTLVETRKLRATNNADTNWRTVFKDLPKYYYDGNVRKTIEYTISESAVEGHVPTYGEQNGTLTVTNNPFTGGKVTLTVDKKWDLDGETDESLKKTVLVDIYYDYDVRNEKQYKETIELNKDNNWKKTVTGLPMYAADGTRELKYWIKEKSVTGFTSVAVTSEILAQNGQTTSQNSEKAYKGYTQDNTGIPDKQFYAGKEHYIIRPDGSTEKIYCMNVNWSAPKGSSKEKAETSYTRILVTDSNLKDYLDPETFALGDRLKVDYSGYASGFEKSDEPYTDLYNKLLRIMYYSYGGAGFSNMSDSYPTLTEAQMTHLTQFAVNEYTDFYYYNNKYNYMIKTRKGYDDDWRTAGPYGLIHNNKSSDPKYADWNYHVDSNLENAYLRLLSLVEAKNTKLDQILSKVKLYVYVPELEEGQTGSYQNLIGVDTASVNKYVEITNKLKRESITLYKHKANEQETYINNVEFELYEPDSTSATTVPFGGEDVHVKKIGGPYKTGSGLNGNGEVKIDGLVVGRTYYLREIKTAPGYQKTDMTIAFTLSGNESAVAEYPWTETTTQVVELKAGAGIATKLNIANNKIYDLPKSGGMGTYWFMIIGAMMMGFALTAGFTKMNLLQMLRR